MTFTMVKILQIQIVKKKRLLILFFLLTNSICFAQIRLPKLIADGMVLQRDKPLKIWGWASPKEKISLNFNKKTYKIITSETGKWEVILPQYPAGEIGRAHV